jgi:uncharacterized protein with HEPN domain
MSNENRLADYLDHMHQAATDACSFVEGFSREDFLGDKRTRQAAIMSLITLGEAATKVIAGYIAFVEVHAETPWRSMRGMRNRMAFIPIRRCQPVEQAVTNGRNQRRARTMRTFPLPVTGRNRPAPVTCTPS